MKKSTVILMKDRTRLTDQQEGCVTAITGHLGTLPDSEQEIVLREVKEQLEDLRAKRAYDSILAGDMPSFESSTVMEDIRSKYRL